MAEPAPVVVRVTWKHLWFPLLLLVLVQSVQLWRDSDLLAEHGYRDTDTYTRLVRVEALATTGQWYDSTLDRANTPYGDALHWTRPFDVLLLASAAPLLPFMETKTALYWAGVAISPVLFWLFVIALTWAAAPLLRGNGLVYLGALAIAQPVLFVYFLPARPDHHSLIAVLFALLIGCFLRLARGPTGARQALTAGLLIGLSVWISVELLVAVAALSMGLALAWIGGVSGLARRGAEMSIVAVAVAALALVIERGLTNSLAMEFDRLSIAHLALLAGAAAFWWLLGLGERVAAARLGVPGRTIVAALVGLVTLGSLWLVLPGLFRGPTANVDPRVMTLWFSNVQEVQPMLRPDRLAEGIGFALAALGPALIGLPFAAQRWMTDVSHRWQWGILMVALVVFLPLAVYQVRWSTYVEAVAVVPYAALLQHLLQLMSSRFAGATPARRIGVSVLRAQTVVLFAGVFLMLSLIFRPPGSAAEVTDEVCRITDVVPALMSGSSPPGGERILASLSFGPELLYRTPHAVVATPYHRNAGGILDSIDFFGAVDESPALKIVRQRGITLVLVCAAKGQARLYSPAESAHTGFLHQRLVEGDPPVWLQPLPLPPTAASFRLFRVVPAK